MTDTLAFGLDEGDAGVAADARAEISQEERDAHAELISQDARCASG